MKLGDPNVEDVKVGIAQSSRDDEEHDGYAQRQFQQIAHGTSQSADVSQLHVEQKPAALPQTSSVASSSTGSRTLKFDDVANDIAHLTIARRQQASSRSSSSSFARREGGSNKHSCDGGSTCPGAEYVRRLAPGISSDSIRLRQRRLDDTSPTLALEVDNTASSDTSTSEAATVQTAMVEQFQQAKHNNRWKLLVAVIAVCCVLVIGVGLGVGYGFKRIKQDTPASFTTTPLLPFTVDCQGLQNRNQPDPVSQCHCNGTVFVIANEVATRYSNLKQTFMLTIAPHFQELQQSCSPQNQALVWLASDNGASDSLSESDLQQRFNLALTFILWNGPSWRTTNGWLSHLHECTWYGISCNSQGKVTHISLSNNTMTGELMPTALLLPSLVSLELDGNSFYGSALVPQIRSMSNLENLQLNATGTNGTIPFELFSLKATLRYLNIAGNELSGTIPTMVANLTQLRYWIAGSNALSGSIPAEFGKCAHLVELELDGNFLNGTIPDQLGLLPLEVLNLDQNNLTGVLPTELFRCTNIATLGVGRNELRGTIPDEIGDLINLNNLFLQNNQLNGTIPGYLSNCTSLIQCDISNNRLNGTVPNELGLLPMIETFDMQGNTLIGGAPAALCKGYVDVYKTSFHCGGCSCDVSGSNYRRA